MKIFDWQQNYDCPVVLVLGYFDCVHVGHAALIEEALRRRGEGEPCVFTFENDMGSFFGKGEGSVLSFAERTERLEELGVKLLFKALFDGDFANTSPRGFLAKLFSGNKIARVVCGFDYTFGRGAEGNVFFLEKFCRERETAFTSVGCVSSGGEKISTTRVKALLSAGNAEGANALLGYSYFLRGKVVRDRGVGRTIGFPTANVPVEKEKFPLKKGVYETYCTVDGKTYPAITNYGSRPTFGLDGILTETHLIGYEGDLYGTSLRVNFLKYLREDRKFGSAEELAEQLKKDEEKAKDDFIRTERKQ